MTIRAWLLMACAVGLLTACSGEVQDSLESKCETDADCGEGSSCRAGFCEGNAPSTDEGSSVVATAKPDGPDVRIDVEIEGTGSCKANETSCEVEPGTRVTFRAPTEDGYRFDHWEGDAGCEGTEPTLVLEGVRKDIMCIAKYVRRIQVSGEIDDGGTPPVASSSAPFADCAGSTCEVDVGSEVVLAPAAREGQRFEGFTGKRCEASAAGTATVEATADTVCVGSYVASASVTGQVANAEGQVTASSTSASAACERNRCVVDEGSQVRLSAPPIDGHRFAGWSGAAGCVGTSPVLVLDDVAGTLTCTANYAARGVVRGTSAGATPAPSIEASASDTFATCTGSRCEVDVGTAVTLTAPTVAGYRLTGWAGAGCDMQSGASVTVTAIAGEIACTAQYVLGVAVIGTVDGAPGQVVSAQSTSPGASCTGASCVIDVGGSVTLTAPSLSTHRFLGWSGDDGCAGNTLAITLSNVQSSKSCTARFVPRHSVSGTASPSAGGSVRASATSATASCAGASCTVDEGATVSLVATAANGYRFTGWSGHAACAGTSPSVVVANVQGTVACQASFVGRVSVSGAANPGAGGSINASSGAASASCSGASCTVDAGSNVSLDLTVNGGYRFTGWSGGTGCTGTADPLALTNVTANTACTATLVQRFTVSGAVTGAANGTAITATSSSNAPQASCSGASCTVDSGVSVTLTAPSLSTHRFLGWSGDAGCTGTALALTLSNVQANKRCTAQYVARHIVSGTASPAAGGSVSASSSNAAASCSGSSCTVDAGSNVTLTATAAGGRRFTGWSGGGVCTGSNASLPITNVQAAVTCQANFATRLTVSGAANPTAGGSVAASSSAAAATCNGASCTVDAGSNVSLDLTTNAGYRFTGWTGGTGCGGTADPLAINSATSNIACTANLVQRFTVTGAVSGAPAGTSVTASASSGAPQASCSGASCTVDSGVGVTLTAPAVAGYRFSGWTGANCAEPVNDGNAATLALGAISAGRTCTASYVRQVTISVATATAGLGSVSVTAGSCTSATSCTVDAGTNVTITATQGGTSRFVAWTGGGSCNGTTLSRSFALNANATCTADFYGLWSRTFYVTGRYSDALMGIVPLGTEDVLTAGFIGPASNETRAWLGELDGNFGDVLVSSAQQHGTEMLQGNNLAGDANGYAVGALRGTGAGQRTVIMGFNANRQLSWSREIKNYDFAEQLSRVTLATNVGYVLSGFVPDGNNVNTARVAAVGRDGTVAWNRTLCLPSSCDATLRTCRSTKAVTTVQTSNGLAVLSEASIPSQPSMLSVLVLTQLDTQGNTLSERFYYRGMTVPSTGQLQLFDLEPANMTALSDGSFVIVGRTREVMGDEGNYDAFVMRVLSDGSVGFNTRFGNASMDEYLYGIAQSGTDYVVVGGAMGANQNLNGWFMRLTSGGALVSADADMSYDLGYTDLLADVAAMPRGGFAMAGFSISNEGENPSGVDGWALRVDGTGKIAFNPGSGATVSQQSHGTGTLDIGPPQTQSCFNNTPLRVQNVSATLISSSPDVTSTPQAP